MASRPSLVTPSGRFEMQESSKFPPAKIPRFVSGGLTEIQVGVNGARSLPDGDKVNVDLHTTTNNFAPNKYREVVNLSGLVVYKESKHKWK